MTARRRSLVAVALVSCLVVGLSACGVARVGGRCRSGFAHDASYVLSCKKGRWTRLTTIGGYLTLMARLQAFPTPGSTGVSSGTGLRAWGGAGATSGANLPTTVLNGHTYKVIDGYVFDNGTSGSHFEVDDAYVLIRNSRFLTAGQVSNTGAILQATPSSRSLIVANSEFEGGPAYQRGVQSDEGDLSVTGSRFHNTGESAVEKNDPAASSSLFVADSYFTNDKGWPGSEHVDGIEVGGAHDVTIHHNTVLNDPYGGANGDTSYVSNSALGLWAEGGDVSGTVTVDGNLLAGGGRTIYLEQKAPYRWRGPVRILNNTFDTRYGPNAAIWGPLSPDGLPANLTWTGNVFSDGRGLSLAAAINNYQ